MRKVCFTGAITQHVKKLTADDLPITENSKQLVRSFAQMMRQLKKEEEN